MTAGAKDVPFKRILLTGGCGFVGRHLLAVLLPRLGADAKVFLATLTPGSDRPDVDEIPFDLRDPHSIAHAVQLARPDLVIHLAAQASVAQAAGDRAMTWDVNLGGTLALAKAIASDAPDATMLFASSAALYGDAFRDGPVSESTVPQPRSVYDRTKYASEMALGDVLPDSARLIVARPSNHSGPGQDHRFVIPSLAAQIHAVDLGQASVVKVGNLYPARDFIDVRDVIDAYLALLSVASTLPNRSVFNISSGAVVTIQELLDRLKRIGQSGAIIEQDPQRMRADEIETAAIDSYALRATTGWAPTRSIDDMLQAIWQDLRSP